MPRGASTTLVFSQKTWRRTFRQKPGGSYTRVEGRQTIVRLPGVHCGCILCGLWRYSWGGFAPALRYTMIYVLRYSRSMVGSHRSSRRPNADWRGLGADRLRPQQGLSGVVRTLNSRQICVLHGIYGRLPVLRRSFNVVAAALWLRAGAAFAAA